LGAVQLFAFLAAWSVPVEIAYQMSLRWTSDVIVAFENPAAKTTTTAWRVDLDSPVIADSLAGLAASENPRVTIAGNQLLIVASTSGTASLAQWDPGIHCAGP
jgi:hypothetical protein